MKNNNNRQTIQPLIDNLVVWITEKCNLNCQYCYAEKSGKNTSLDTLNAILDFISQNPELFAKQLIVNFTGGEPLMAKDNIKYFVEQCSIRKTQFKSRFQYGIITNGTLIDDNIMDFLTQYQFNTIISIDGNKKINDFQRPLINGNSSYRNDYPELIAKFRQNRITPGARLTFTPQSLNITENIEHLINLGFEEISILCDMEETWESTDGNLEKQLQKALYQLADYYLDKMKSYGISPNIKGFHEYLIRYIFTRNLGKQKPLTPCGSGKNIMGITADGHIYPCHHWNNQNRRKSGGHSVEQYRIGSIYTRIDAIKRQPFIDYNADEINECKICPAKLICGGPCYAMAALCYGNIKHTLKGQCNYTKALFHAIQYLYSKISFEDRHLLNNIRELKSTRCNCCG